MSAGVEGSAELHAAGPPSDDELRVHALDLAGRLLGDRRTVEAAEDPLPADAEAVSLLEGRGDPGRLLRRLERVREAVDAGLPAVVYLPNRAMEPSGEGLTPQEVWRAFEGVDEAVFLEQRAVECSLGDLGEGPPAKASAAGASVGPPRRMLVVVNLPDAVRAEGRLASAPADGPRRRALERRLAELRARNLELARARSGRPLDQGARARARLAERRLLFARIRETVSVLLARRRLRG